MKAVISGDLVIGWDAAGTIGVVVPPDLQGLPQARLRYVDGEIVDAADIDAWYVDDNGAKHAVALDPSWLALVCAWDAVLIGGPGAWRAETAAERLAALKDRAKAQIDAEAERQRLRWITPGAGQAMTYARKVEQAKAVLAAVDPQPADYPMLAASIGIDGADIVGVANTVVAMDAAWEQIGAAIEAARLTAKQEIDGAGSVAAVEAVEVVWPQS
jgi:hypothetical protein